MKIYSFLRRGEKNAIPLQSLTFATGLSSRAVRSAIRRERLNGALILSGETGYYLADNAEEIENFVRSMQGRADEIYHVADAVEQAGIGVFL